MSLGKGGSVVDPVTGHGDDPSLGMQPLDDLLTRPDGSQVVLSLVETEAGVFETALTATAVGVYRFRFLAEGSTLRGRPFTRGALATGAITSSDVVTTIGEQPDDKLCRFLDCLLKSQRRQPLS
jgi:hypothetical protein